MEQFSAACFSLIHDRDHCSQPHWFEMYNPAAGPRLTQHGRRPNYAHLELNQGRRKVHCPSFRFAAYERPLQPIR